MAAEPLRVAVVGLGYWGPNLLRTLAETEGARVVAACDTRSELRSRWAARYPAVRFEAVFESLLSASDVDAIAIATPAATHESLALAALRARKHVLVEKPLALTEHGAQALIDAATSAERTLMVGHTFEYNPAVLKLKEVVRGPAFGRPVYAYSTRVNLGQIRNDVNAMWNLAPHDISILLFLFEEEPTGVTAMGRAFVQPEQEDVVFLHLEFPSGAIAHIHISWLDPSKVRRVTVVGERQMAVYDDLDPEAKLRIYDKGIDAHPVPLAGGLVDYSLKLRAGDIVCPQIAWKEPLLLECAHFVECARAGTRPRTDGENGRRVTRILEAAQQSLRSRGGRVAL